MKGLFSIDGPLYKICNLIFYSIVCNILCFLLAIPGILSLIFIGYDSIVGLLALAICSSPIGPGLTASFYMMRKLQKGEGTGPMKEFWKSLKLNFKQSALAWIILFAIGIIIYINIRSILVVGNPSKILLPIQFVFALELLFTSIYIFPIISKYENSLGLQLKLSWMLSNRHLPTTLACGLIAFVLILVLYYYPPVMFFIGIGIYVFSCNWLIERVLLKHWPEKKECSADEY